MINALIHDFIASFSYMIAIVFRNHCPVPESSPSPPLVQITRDEAGTQWGLHIKKQLCEGREAQERLHTEIPWFSPYPEQKDWREGISRE